jgi:hypothetical protein
MKALRFIVAVVLTLLVVVAARRFGPNYSYVVEASCPDFTLEHKAPRSHEGTGPAPLLLKVSLISMDEPAEEVILEPVRTDKEVEGCDLAYVFEVPPQAPTTRFFYRFEGYLKGEGQPRVTLEREGGGPMMVKFKLTVPSWILISHILAMFAGFFLLIWSSLYGAAVMRGAKEAVSPARRLAWWAWAVLFIGGVPIGIAMNYYAFNVYWEAWPFGGDVTDNKTQIALVIWGIAAIGLTVHKGRKSGLAALLAGVAVLFIFLIPHSL